MSVHLGGARPRIVFHIGLEKTATTSFQRYCNENRAALLRQGLLYPRAAVARGGINHKLLAASYLQHQPKDRALALKVPPRRDLVRAIGQEARRTRARLVLVSAEHLSSRFDQDAIAALAADFADYDVTILVAVRDHHARFRSSYTTYVLGGGRKSLEAYEADLLSAGSRYLSVRDTVEPWETVFGRQHVQFLDYDAEPDMIAAPLRACGLQPGPIDAARYRDVASPRPAVVQLLHAVNRAIEAHQAASPDESDAAWLQLIATSVLLRKRALRLAAPVGDRPLLMSPQGSAALDAIAQRDRLWLEQRYGMRLKGAPARATTAPSNETGPDLDRLAETLVGRVPRALWLVGDALVRLSQHLQGSGRRG